jgi:hypothetical protein
MIKENKMSDTPREYTREEVRDAFSGHIRTMIKFWNGVENKSKEEALEGLAFSILAMLDGCSAGLPCFAVIPLPHPEDKNFCIENGENWYPEFEPAEGLCDIGGGLHHLICNKQ